MSPRDVGRARAVCWRLASALVPLWIACAGAASAEADDASAERQPYGLQRFEDATHPDDETARAPLSPATAALLGGVASAALLLVASRLRARRRAPAEPEPSAPTHDDATSRAAGEPLLARTPEPGAGAREALGLALEALDRDRRAASNRAAEALRRYGADRWLIDLRALTTPEIERALADAETPVTSREFVRLLSRYDAERFQDERTGALGRDALRACIEASLRFVDDTAARPDA